MMIPLKQFQKLLQRIWGNWNIHAIVVASLGFQCVLEFVAPLRKRRKKVPTHLTIWCAYLLADYFATFGIALINSNSNEEDAPGDQSSLLEAFWAPFLLLHLGGPHAITSFNIEDNNLWHRPLLTLIVQSFSVLLVFYRYKIYRHRCLAISAGIVFFAGIVKYAERIHSLFLASVPHMRRSMLENNSSSSSSLSKETEEALVAKNPDKMEIIHSGYIYYKLFKGFILDHAFIHIEDKLEAVKKVFLELKDPETAYKILEMELNFMYDSMFTKMAAVQWISSIEYAYRFVVHGLLVAVTITFYLCDKSRSSSIHISITYILLGGAVVLDLVSIVKLVCSEWTVALMMEKPSEERKWIMKGINTINTWGSSTKRWSKEIRQYSLINHSFKQRWKPLDKIINRSGLIREKLDAWQYTTIQPVGNVLLKRVFHAIKNKANQQQQEEGTQTKGQGGGDEQPPKVHHEYDNCVLIWHVATEICYFTGQPAKIKDPNNRQLCRNISEYLVYFLVMEGKLTSTVPGNIGLRFKDICWEEVQHTINEIVDGLSKTRFWEEDTYKRKRTRWEKLKMKWEDKKRGEVCEQLLRLKLRDRSKNGSDDDYAKSILSKAIELAHHLKSCCRQDPEGRPNPADNNNPNPQNEQDVEIPGYIKLAKHLKRCCGQDPDPEGPPNPAGNNNNNNNNVQKEQDVENPGSAEELAHPNRQDNHEDLCSEEELWKVVSHVWIGMLLYGASHCRDDVQYLNKGGELLTFVRLLMVHFGLREAFKDEGGFKLAQELHKLITDIKLPHFLPKIITSDFLP